MTRRRRATPDPMYQCTYCQAHIAEQRPVVLIQTGSGELVGPYHGGCAEKVVRASRGDYEKLLKLIQPYKVYGYWPREEVLP